MNHQVEIDGKPPGAAIDAPRVSTTCALVTVDAGSTNEAAALMRELGFRNTQDLRWKVQGMTVDDLVGRFAMVPNLCRFKRSGKVLANAYYWTAEQEREIALCSVRWLEDEIQRLKTAC